MLELDKYLKLDDEIHEKSNLTDRFDEVDLRRIARYCLDGYETDLRSRQTWLDRNQAGMDLAMQVTETKSFPWPGAANVAFPLITIAAMQFHARAYPAVINGKEVVKVKEYPGAPQTTKINCQRAAAFMNVQLLETSTAWEEGSDRLLLNYSIVGCAFKKGYFSSVEGDVVSELVFARDLVLDYFAKSVDVCRRKSQCYPLHRNALIEGMRTDPPKYRRVEKEGWFTAGPQAPVQAEDQENRDGTTKPPAQDPATPFSVIEQHCWLDLDNDGYEEPYIVTIDLGSEEILRLVTRWDRPEDIVRNARKQILRINAVEYFTKYGFVPSPDGSIYDIGFGVLLGPLNESVSTIVNQLIDAGTKLTTGGGFLGKGAKIRGGTYSFAPGEWKRVDSTGEDLQKSIVPLKNPDPSPVLFQLLGLLIEYTNRIAGTMETMVGENPGQNTPKSNMDAMIEQGMKIYTAIFKRTWRALKEEFRKIYILNGLYQPPQIAQYFYGDPRLCCPTADPNIASDAERRTRALIIAERAQTVPGYNPVAVEMNLLTALKVDNPQDYYQGPPAEQGPSEKLQIEMLKQQGKDKDRQMAMQQLVIELQAGQPKVQAEIAALMAQVQESLANAEDARDNRTIVTMQTLMSLLKQREETVGNMLDKLIKISEIESEPERKPKGLDNVRRLALASVYRGAAAPLLPQAGGTQGAMGPAGNPLG